LSTGRTGTTTVALFARLEAKPGKEDALREFLQQGLCSPRRRRSKKLDVLGAKLRV
jgi:hypothetical protein